MSDRRTGVWTHGEAAGVGAVVAPPNGGPETEISDLNMLASPGGQERTRKKFAALLAATGSHMKRIVEVDARRSVIEAAPSRE